MKSELLCTWLGLPTTAWPPDAWTLLGVGKDEHNLAVIESRVQDCMLKLRSYQLAHPEEATEGMNRLAEAFIALTEACAKAKPSPAEPASTYELSIVPHAQAQADWRAAPPPVRDPNASGTVPAISGKADVAVAKPFVAPSRIQRGLDAKQIRELAEESEEATSGLATLDAVVERVDHTRALLHAWERLGKLLKSPAKKVAPKEGEAYDTRLEKINEAMEGFPGFLGHPGKPGYRVAVQARLRLPLAMVRAISDQQKQELVLDWEAGRQLLLAHRKYLRRMFCSMRRRTIVGLVLHAMRAFVNDHPVLVLAAAAGLAGIAALIYVWWIRR